MFKKLIEKLFGKRCACGTKSICDHSNLAVKKVVQYCLDCNKVIEEI